MRIGLVSKFGAADGLCVRAQYVLKSLVKRGHDVHVFTQANIIDGVPKENIHRFRALQLNPHFWLDSPSAMRLISQKCIEHEIDVLHIQMNSSSSEFLIPFFKRSMPPIITTFHLAYAGGSTIYRTGFAFAWKTSMFAVKRYDHIVLVDPKQKEVMKEYGISNDKMTVIINGVDTDLFCPRIEKVENGIIDFVYVGRLSLDKGTHHLLEAFSEYHKENRKSRLTLVGDGLLKFKISDYNIDNSIRWLGTLEHHMVPMVLQNADVFVIPQNIGGLGLSVIEAMSCGIPVITTAIGETINLLDEDEGVLVKPDSKDAVLGAMRKLGADEDLRRKMGKKCREKILRHYSWKTQTRLLEDVYKQTISSH